MRPCYNGRMELLYCDNYIAVCVKPAGALSTDEPGGVPELARAALGDLSADVRTVHRLDRVVGGVMLLARSAEMASALGRQVMDGRFPLLQSVGGLSCLRITLRTGRTHQIRAQFAFHGLPLVGDRKYGTGADGETPIALWSERIAFDHPATGAPMAFRLPPPKISPWTEFALDDEEDAP